MSRLRTIRQLRGDPAFGLEAAFAAAERGAGLAQRIGSIFGGGRKRRRRSIPGIASTITTSPMAQEAGIGELIKKAPGLVEQARRMMPAVTGAPGLMLEPFDGFALQRGRTGKPRRLIAPSGRVVNLVRRRRGISATELRGFRKVNRLLHSIGMRPSRRRRRA